MNSWILEVQWYLLRDHTLDNNYCLEVYTNSMKHKYQRNNHLKFQSKELHSTKASIDEAASCPLYKFISKIKPQNPF